MSTLAYHAALCQAQAPSPTSPDEALVRQFWDEAKRQVVTGDYLRRKWMPRQGHRFYTLIKVLRGYCSYSIKQGEAPCFPSYEALAQACHVCRRTICTWLAHDEQGRFTHSRHGEALNRFLRVQPRRRYDPAGQRQVKTSNLYLVRMDDPVIPEDETLVWEKAAALATRHLEQQREEQERQARKRNVDEAGTRATSFVERDCTLNNRQKLHPQSSAETAQDRLPSTLPFTSDFHRSAQEEECIIRATRSEQAAAQQQASRTRDEEDEASAASKSTSNSATAQRSEDQSQRAAPLDGEAEDRQREAAFAAAYEAAGGVVSSLLEELGDTNAAGGTRRVLFSLVAAGAPPEQMGSLAYLARDRVRAFVLRGGRILDTQVGFYITTLCNLAKEARRKDWNLEQMAAADRRRHERAIRQREQRRAAQTLPQEVKRPAQRTVRWPTPAEAEALVLELGQRKETYVEAQTQARRQHEVRQTREARQAAARQQADLFRQLAQAHQALQETPEDSPVWERVQQEKQEIERRIAAWRSPAGGAALATGVSVQTPKCSEQEYREAIQGWAQTRSWTVAHGKYSGS